MLPTLNGVYSLPADDHKHNIPVLGGKKRCAKTSDEPPIKLKYKGNEYEKDHNNGIDHMHAPECGELH